VRQSGQCRKRIPRLLVLVSENVFRRHSGSPAQNSRPVHEEGLRFAARHTTDVQLHQSCV
ncbi:unnamed protein product, partial [Nesidiocoris tenuis]